jgi:hypothetical protein
MSEDALEDVQRDARVSEPGRARVAETVPGEIGEPEVGDEGVTLGGVANCRCSSASDARSELPLEHLIERDVGADRALTACRVIDRGFGNPAET